MSLINDALKRTQQVQQQAAPAGAVPAPPAAAPEARSPNASPPATSPPAAGAAPQKIFAAQPEPVADRGPNLMRIGAVGGASLLALFLIWQGVRHNAPAPLPVAAAQGTTASSLLLAQGKPALDRAKVILAQKETELREDGLSRTSGATNVPPAGVASTPAPGSAPGAAAAPAAAETAQAPTTKAPAPKAAETAPPGPPPIRLQGIVFHPTRPSAMINGKTLFIGDMLGGMQLVAIGPQSATLVGGGQTNLLTLR